MRHESVYLHGAEHGRRRIWYPDGQIQLECMYVDGRPTAPLVVYHSNGAIKQLVDEGLVSREYFPDGMLQSEGTFTPIETDGEYVWNAKGGEWRFWFHDGTLEYRCSYRDGVKHGLAEQWHENGQIQSAIECEAGKFHGLALWWDDEGRLIGAGHYDRGQVVGTWTHWYPSSEGDVVKRVDHPLTAGD